jgi:hypothetical protein
MLFDTDVLIWFLRGHPRAATLVDHAPDRSVSVVTCMELLQGARSKQEIKTIKNFLAEFAFRVVPLTENVGHRALVYMEEYALKAGMSMADALIAASAVEDRLVLLTANQKHYKAISDLEMKVFKP